MAERNRGRPPHLYQHNSGFISSPQDDQEAQSYATPDSYPDASVHAQQHASQQSQYFHQLEQRNQTYGQQLPNNAFVGQYLNQVGSYGAYAAGPVAGPYAAGPVAGPYAAGPVAGLYAAGPVAGPYAAGPVAGPYAAGPVAGPYAAGPVAGPYAAGPVAGPYAAGPVAGPYAAGPVAGPYAAGPVAGPYAPGPVAGPYAPGPVEYTVRQPSPAGTYLSGHQSSAAPFQSHTASLNDPVTSEAGGYATAVTPQQHSSLNRTRQNYDSSRSTGLSQQSLPGEVARLSIDGPQERFQRASPQRTPERGRHNRRGTFTQRPSDATRRRWSPSTGTSFLRTSGTVTTFNVRAPEVRGAIELSPRELANTRTLLGIPQQ
ncbi:hypothetical protein MTO96_039521 [Rhipicephalus appendiculatus]